MSLVFSTLSSLFWGAAIFYAGFWVRGWLHRTYYDPPPALVDRFKAFMDAAMKRAIEVDENKKRTAFGKAPIPKSIWKKVVSLAHPDKHKNSEVATEVTAWLLEHRPKK